MAALSGKPFNFSRPARRAAKLPFSEMNEAWVLFPRLIGEWHVILIETWSLLNSDAEVANNWLDRIQRCARADAKIGTVTPFSNNATICSFPQLCSDNPLPEGTTLTELDRVFQKLMMVSGFPSPQLSDSVCT